MQALILAAGFGVRLREIVHGRPKHLAPVNGQPFLRHLIVMLKKKGVSEVVLAVGYLAQHIIDEFSQPVKGLEIKFSEDNRPLGTGGSLKKAQRFFKQSFLVINGDTYLDIDYRRLLLNHQQSKTLITIVGTARHKNKGGIIIPQGNKVGQFIPDPQTNIPGSSLRNAGVYAVSPQIFDFIPADTKISLEKEIIPSLLKTKRAVNLFEINKSFIDIGSPQSYHEAQKLLK